MGARTAYLHRHVGGGDIDRTGDLDVVIIDRKPEIREPIGLEDGAHGERIRRVELQPRIPAAIIGDKVSRSPLRTGDIDAENRSAGVPFRGSRRPDTERKRMAK